jgi:UDPglucose 6-dehydrogenase
MNVGMIGLGKLGLPCVLAMEQNSEHDFFGFDISETVKDSIKRKNVSYWEEGVNKLLEKSDLKITGSIKELVDICDLIFISVQTPHDKNYEGRTPTPDKKKDFDYSFLTTVVEEIAKNLALLPDKNPLVVIISTVLPGTIKEKVIPVFESYRSNIRLAYNPYFIAMGTTIRDFLNPEFILIGTTNLEDFKLLENFYKFIAAPVAQMQIESAELTKVAYNTFIGFKIVFSNSLAEITEELGGDVDEVTRALSLADQRLMSGAYMTAGLGDGGGCHPRDQIAMSWLSEKINASSNLFSFLAEARDSHSSKIADQVIKLSEKFELPVCLLGVSYKPNSPIDTGSPARLVQHYLEHQGIAVRVFDPLVEPNSVIPKNPHVFILGCRHDSFKDVKFPKDSVVLDPWGFFPGDGKVYTLIKPGRTSY